MAVNDFNLFVGSEFGILKGVNLNSNSNISKNFTCKSLKDKSAITSLSWLEEDEENILVGFENHTLAIYESFSKSFVWNQTDQLGDGSLVTTLPLGDNRFLCGLSSGKIVIQNEGENHSISTIPAGRYPSKMNLSTLRASPTDNSLVATGGKQNDLAIWDLNRPETNNSVFKAKNVSHDMLDLRVPVWISDLSFISHSSCLVATCSRHKHVRLYDTKTQRRPVVNFEWENHPLTSISGVSHHSDDRRIVVGTNHGRMALFDVRKLNGQTPVRVYKGFAGSVASISVHPTLPLVFSVSLDRFVRVHHLENRNDLIYKHFLKSRLSCLLLRRNMKESDFGLAENSDLGLSENESKRCLDDGNLVVKIRKKNKLS